MAIGGSPPGIRSREESKRTLLALFIIGFVALFCVPVSFMIYSEISRCTHPLWIEFSDAGSAGSLLVNSSDAQSVFAATVKEQGREVSGTRIMLSNSYVLVRESVGEVKKMLCDGEK